MKDFLFSWDLNFGMTFVGKSRIGIFISQIGLVLRQRGGILGQGRGYYLKEKDHTVNFGMSLVGNF
jgi:hypothetical protein